MRFILALIASLISFNHAVAASLEEDVQHYIRIFSGDKALHSEAVDKLEWMGLSDTRLFDIIEGLILENADDRGERNRVAKYIRSLGFSGESKYYPTIMRFVRNRTYNPSFANGALRDLPRYSKWNPVISNRSSFDPKFSDDVNRVANMLRSDDLLLQRVGAKAVYSGVQEDILLELLAQLVRANYARTDLTGSERIDSVAWQVKALGSSRNAKYRALLEEVAEKGKQQAVVKHASEALVRYYGCSARDMRYPNSVVCG
jgi:hypothetical protein